MQNKNLATEMSTFGVEEVLVHARFCYFVCGVGLCTHPSTSYAKGLEIMMGRKDTYVDWETQN